VSNPIHNAVVTGLIPRDFVVPLTSALSINPLIEHLGPGYKNAAYKLNISSGTGSGMAGMAAAIYQSEIWHGAVIPIR